MTQDFLPVPEQVPPVPDQIEPLLGVGASGNQRVGCAMFARTEGATLTELRKCCERHLLTYAGNSMPLSTATQTKNKLKYHWRWRATGDSCIAVSTGETRGGEVVFRITEHTTYTQRRIRPKVVAASKSIEISGKSLRDAIAPALQRETEKSATFRIEDPMHSVYANGVVEAMLDYVPPPILSERNIRATHLDSWRISREVGGLILDDPNAFLIGSLFNYQIPFEKAWEAPLKLKQRLGHLDVSLIANMRLEDLHAAISGQGKGQSLHRFNSILTNRVISACRHLVTEYDASSTNIWPDNISGSVLVSRLQMFDGISQKIANMMARQLGTWFGVHLEDWGTIDIAVDRHVERVFRRAGLVSNLNRQTKQQVIQKARELCPDFPGKLDDPAFWIGLNWCNEQRPRCDEPKNGRTCPLSKVCRRIQI